MGTKKNGFSRKNNLAKAGKKNNISYHRPKGAVQFR